MGEGVVGVVVGCVDGLFVGSSDGALLGAEDGLDVGVLVVCNDCKLEGVRVGGNEG